MSNLKIIEVTRTSDDRNRTLILHIAIHTALSIYPAPVRPWPPGVDEVRHRNH